MGFNLIAKTIPAVTGGLFDFERGFETQDPLLITPANVIFQYLVDQGLMTDPEDGNDWPLHISRMPDSPSNIGAIYDTVGIKDGRYMIGTVIQHFGIQIKIRNIDYTEGWEKIEAITLDLDTVINETVTSGGEDYLVQNVKRAGLIASLGSERGTKKRQLFTSNFLVTMKRIA